MATVVTVEQLQAVASAQKSYIDNKDSDLVKKISDAKTEAATAASNAKSEAISDAETKIDAAKTELQGKIDAIVVPDEASAEEIKGITDLFAVDQAAE